MSFTLDQSLLGLRYYDVGAFKDKSHPTAVQRGEERGFKLKTHEKQPDLPLSLFYFNLRTDDNPKPGPLTPELVAESGQQLYRARGYPGA